MHGIMLANMSYGRTEIIPGWDGFAAPKLEF